MTDKNEFDNDYCQALIFAGAEVLAFKTFGSYQGDWIAKIKLNGEILWIHDYYGSCSGCDAFQSEVDIEWHQHEDGKTVWGIDGFKEDCEACQKMKTQYADFGKKYFEDTVSYEKLLENVGKNIEWDYEAQEMVDWVKNNK